MFDDRKDNDTGHSFDEWDGRKPKKKAPFPPTWVWVCVAAILVSGAVGSYLIARMIMTDPMVSMLVQPSMGSPFSSGYLTDLPKYNSSDFTKVIKLPSVNSLTVWQDTDGNDCLAARAGDEVGFSEGQIAVVYGKDLSEFGRMTFKQNSWAANSNYMLVKDVTADGKPEVFAGISADEKDELKVFDLTGSELFSTTLVEGSGDRVIVDNSPSNGKNMTLVLADGSLDAPPYLAFDMPSGAANSKDVDIFKSKVGTPDYFNCFIRTDWDGDGDRDYVFLASEDTTRKCMLIPYCNGQFLDGVPVDVSNYFEFSKFARYKDANGDWCILAAGYDAVHDPKTDKSTDDYIGNNLKWYVPGKTAVMEKMYKSKRTCYGGEVWDVVDVTGDGIPEICALVVDTRLVILDLDGNELLNEEYFGKTVGMYDSLDYLVSGDFDQDGFNDLAFSYENGIWLPDLSAIRGK